MTRPGPPGRCPSGPADRGLREASPVRERRHRPASVLPPRGRRRGSEPREAQLRPEGLDSPGQPPQRGRSLRGAAGLPLPAPGLAPAGPRGGAAPPAAVAVGAGRRVRMAAVASPARELTQNPLQKTWEPYDNGLPAGHSAQRGGERGGGGGSGLCPGRAVGAPAGGSCQRDPRAAAPPSPRRGRGG